MNKGKVKPIRQNQRRLKPKAMIPSRWQVKWKQSLVRISAILLSLILLFVGGRALNQILTVTHWHSDAPSSMAKKIDMVLSTQVLDFWHSRSIRIEQKLLQDIPDLAAVTVQRDLPNGLNIQVRLRQPIGLWENDRGVVSLVDEQGEVYRALKQGENVDLPMLRMPKKYLKKVSKILNILHSSSSKWFALNSEILTDSLGWKMNFNHGQQWLLPFGVKAVHNVALLSQIVEEYQWSERQWHINTRMSHHWFLREIKHKGGHLGG
ncbi:MAG: cell division protein FtsQ/DivIB [Mariprofundaceae bacterium]|nr:cell division protein FtsQ/DivIB [Mariprofundaceae bacterium]